MKEHIDNVIEEMDEIVELLWRSEEEAYQKLVGYVNGWQQILQEMLEHMCLYIKEGKEIPLDIILCQLENFDMALKRKDDMMLADVLGFELKETLNYYKGLLEIYDGK